MQSPIKIADVKPWTISQGTLLLGVVLIGFAIYLMLNGRLSTYWALMLGGKAPAGSPGAQAAAEPPATQVPQTALNTSSGSGDSTMSALQDVASIASDLAFLG